MIYILFYRGESSINIYYIRYVMYYFIFFALSEEFGKYIKKLLQSDWLYIKGRYKSLMKQTNVINNKQSELKYLSNFRKRNQTRFYE